MAAFANHGHSSNRRTYDVATGAAGIQKIPVCKYFYDLASRIMELGSFAMKEKSNFREQGGRIRQAVLIDTLQPEGR